MVTSLKDMSLQKTSKNINAKSQKEWFNSVKGGNKPNDIPYKPNRRYKEEWKGWADFLGKEN